MALTSVTVIGPSRLDKKCGASGIPDHKKCTKATGVATAEPPENGAANTARPVSPKQNKSGPDFAKLALAATAIGGVSAVTLAAVDNVVQVRSRQYGEPTFKTFTQTIGDPDTYINAPGKTQVAAGAFGQTSFVEVEGQRYVVKEPKKPSKEERRAMAAGLTNAATRNLYRAQGRVTQSEVSNARLAGSIGAAPRVVSADRRALVTDVAAGAPVKEFNDQNKQQLFQTLAKLHRADIAHNDLKEDNVFEDPKSGRLQLIDFGLSMRDSGAVTREWYRAMNPPSPNILLRVTGTATGAFDLKKINPTGYAKAEAALSKVLGGSVSEERIMAVSRDQAKAKQMKLVVDNFYAGKYNPRPRKDSEMTTATPLTPLTTRIDKKCGASGISKEKKCTKGTSGASTTSGLEQGTSDQLRGHSQMLQNDLIVKFGGMDKAAANFNGFKQWAVKQPEYKELRAVQSILATRDDSMTITLPTTRIDKKCGNSGIPENAKCSKGGSGAPGSGGNAIGIGAAALTAGGITALALSRGGGRKKKTEPYSNVPDWEATKPTPGRGGPRPSGGTPALPAGRAPRALLSAAAPPPSKTQRMRANTAAAAANARGRIGQTAREEVRRVAQIGNTMAATGEATGMAAKTAGRELRLRVEAARRKYEPGYRSADKPKPQRALPAGGQPVQFPVASSVDLPRERIPAINPATGQPRRRRARGFGRSDSLHGGLVPGKSV